MKLVASVVAYELPAAFVADPFETKSVPLLEPVVTANDTVFQVALPVSDTFDWNEVASSHTATRNEFPKPPGYFAI